MIENPAQNHVFHEVYYSCSQFLLKTDAAALWLASTA